MQTFVLILVGVIVGMFLAWLVGLFTYTNVIGVIMGMMYGTFVSGIITGFNLLIPLVCMAILMLVVFLNSFLILRKYLKNSTSSVLQEVVE